MPLSFNSNDFLKKKRDFVVFLEINIHRNIKYLCQKGNLFHVTGEKFNGLTEKEKRLPNIK